MGTKTNFFDALTSIFRHNFMTSFIFVVLIVLTLFSVGFQCRLGLFSVQTSLNILVFMGFIGIALKSWQLFRKRKV